MKDGAGLQPHVALPAGASERQHCGWTEEPPVDSRGSVLGVGAAACVPPQGLGRDLRAARALWAREGPSPFLLWVQRHPLVPSSAENIHPDWGQCLPRMTVGQEALLGVLDDMLPPPSAWAEDAAALLCRAPWREGSPPTWSSHSQPWTPLHAQTWTPPPQGTGGGLFNERKGFCSELGRFLLWIKLLPAYCLCSSLGGLAAATPPLPGGSPPP